MVAPAGLPAGKPFTHFAGTLAQVKVDPEELSAERVHAMAAAVPPDVALLRLEEASQPWPMQVREQAGYLTPQDPALMPHSRAGVALPLSPSSPTALTVLDNNTWTVKQSWMLPAVPDTA